jgi:hypothetical protein
VTKRRRLIGGVIVLLAAVLGLLGASASHHREKTVKQNAHEELLREDGNASPVSCVQSGAAGADYATPSILTSSYRCTSENGARVADVRVQQPLGLTAFKGRQLSAMVAEESR